MKKLISLLLIVVLLLTLCAAPSLAVEASSAGAAAAGSEEGTENELIRMVSSLAGGLLGIATVIGIEKLFGKRRTKLLPKRDLQSGRKGRKK